MTAVPRLMTRRTILHGGVAGTLALAIPACGMGASPPNGPVPGGNVAQIAIDALELVPGEYVVLGRDAGGLYAMSGICPHQGGSLFAVDNTAASGLECSRHHSTFNGVGVVTRGPAVSNLLHYQVDLATDGGITIRGDRQVDPGVRTPVDT